RAAAQPIDPGACREREDDQRKALHGAEGGYFERCRPQRGDGDERQREQADLASEPTHGRRGPEIDEVAVPPQRSAQKEPATTPGYHRSSLWSRARSATSRSSPTSTTASP